MSPEECRTRPEAATTAESPPASEPTTCALCGTREAEIVYRACPDRRHWVPGTFDVVRCRSCGLVRTYPRPSLDEMDAFYPSSYVCFAAEERPRGPAYAAFRSLVRLPYRVRYGPVGAVPAPPRPGAHLLDVGAGTGQFIGKAEAAGWEAWGVEPDPASARLASERTRRPDRIVVGKAERADFPDESFDLVTMAHVLEHLHEPRRVLRNAHRWLRPGGRLVLQVPNFDSIERRVFGRYWFGLDVPRHLSHFTPSTLRTLLADSGFATVRVVPQWQANTLGWSLAHVSDGALRRRRQFRESMGLYYAFLPLAAALAALGNGGAMEVLATKQASVDGASG